jgi:hypothetical protein
VQFVDEARDGEDDVSIAAQIAAMKNQMSRTLQDTKLIEDRMDRTYKSRRQMVLNGTPVDKILEDYPALRNPSQVQWQVVVEKIGFTVIIAAA